MTRFNARFHAHVDALQRERHRQVTLKTHGPVARAFFSWVEPDHLAVLQNRERIGGQIRLLHGVREQTRRFVERIVGEFEHAPVNADGLLRAHVLEDAHSLFRIDVLRAHEPARRIRADRNQREIEAAETRADIAKVRRITGGVAREIKRVRVRCAFGRLHDPATP